MGRYAVLLSAAARAAAGSHVPLMIHTEKGLHVMEALEICYRAGLKPENIIVCHVDRQASDFGPHDRIAAEGVWLDFDTVGRFKYHSDAEEVALLQHLMPYAGKIMSLLTTPNCAATAKPARATSPCTAKTLIPMAATWTAALLSTS